MKGDLASVVCPKCGSVLNVKAYHERCKGYRSIRRSSRSRLYRHLYGVHPGMGMREMSLLLDEVVP